MKNKNALVYRANLEGCIVIAKLINGKLRTDKINNFNYLLELVNKRISTRLIPQEKDTSILTNSYWLAGFSDALPNILDCCVKKSSSSKQKIKKASQETSPGTSLIIWGQNLTSSVGLGRFTKQESNMIQLPSFFKSVICGLLLSDGWLTFASKTHKNARLGFKQSLSNSGYFWFVFSFLSHYCSSMPSLISSYRKETKTYALQIFTRSLSCFTEIHTIFYANGIKIIPENIYNLLTPVALAHLIMGDGNAREHGLILCTNSYSVQDVVRLMNVLMIRYRLESTIHLKRRQNQTVDYMIYIRQKSIPLLRTIVIPYMHSSMLYKLGGESKDPFTTSSITLNFCAGAPPWRAEKGSINSFNQQVELLHKNKIGNNKNSLNQVKYYSYSSPFQIKAFKRPLSPLESTEGGAERVLENRKFRYNIRLNYQIKQKDKLILEQIKRAFGGVVFYKKSQDVNIYSSCSFGSARNIIKYLDRFHLQSHNYVNYLKWRKAYKLVQNKKFSVFYKYSKN